MNKIIVVIISFFIISGCTIPKTSEIADDVASSSKKIIGDDTVNIGTNNDENSKIQKSNNPININTEDSIVMWNGKKITGTEENGKIKIKQGSLSLSNEQIVTGGEFTINMDSIKENKNTETLEKHLKSTDFFDTAQYPEAKLKITYIEPSGKLLDKETTYNITADLTIKGLTRDIVFPAIAIVKDNVFSAKAEFTIDRTRWNIKYGSGKFFQNLGDKLIDDKITFKLNLIADMPEAPVEEIILDSKTKKEAIGTSTPEAY